MRKPCTSYATYGNQTPNLFAISGQPALLFLGQRQTIDLDDKRHKTLGVDKR
mgnify:CR=1 FL=1